MEHTVRECGRETIYSALQDDVLLGIVTLQVVSQPPNGPLQQVVHVALSGTELLPSDNGVVPLWRHIGELRLVQIGVANTAEILKPLSCLAQSPLSVLRLRLSLAQREIRNDSTEFVEELLSVLLLNVLRLRSAPHIVVRPRHWLVQNYAICFV